MYMRSKLDEGRNENETVTEKGRGWLMTWELIRADRWTRLMRSRVKWKIKFSLKHFVSTTASLITANATCITLT